MFLAQPNNLKSSQEGNGGSSSESADPKPNPNPNPNPEPKEILGCAANDLDLSVEDVPTQRPHFLDYDAVPPTDLEASICAATNVRKLEGPPPREQQRGSMEEALLGRGEKLKVDKKYERDGEISDCELAANGYTKKEFTQDDNTLHLDSGYRTAELRKNNFNKPKHFLDENPIPPDYMMMQHELREHRSLDRNFERKQNERSSSSPVNSLVDERRKSSLDRSGILATSSEFPRLSRDRVKTHSYALSRFLSSPPCTTSLPAQTSRLSQSVRVPKGAAWTTENFEIDYDKLISSTRSNELDIDSLGPKVECVYSLLSMLGSNDPLDMSKKFLELSRTPETCATLRRSGCIPLLVQMMHSADADDIVRKHASMALHNVVHSNPDEKVARREAKVLRHLDQITDYCNFLKTLLQSGGEGIADDTDRHPLAAISSLMKVSFDEEHRHAMCELGALHNIPNLVHLDHAAHGPNPVKSTFDESENVVNEEQNPAACNSLRRYALMALTNLTFGDEKNKAQLCSQKPFMEALVAQLDSAPDDLLQVTASVLRNLSWRADSNMKSVLNEIGTVTALARAAMKNKNENTLKAILSALWNLSAHCSTNKAEFCAVDGALAFLVDMLTYEGPSKTLKIIENAGGILRNVSSHIAVRENYRQILRERNCLAILLQQLKSESLTVVSNSCGTLWNLSARCPVDQKFLWDNGAVPMLRSLIHSKHAMISEGSSSALKNLLNFRPTSHNHTQLDPIARSMGLKKLPTLNARKQRALQQELCAKVHTETCENLDNLVNGGGNDGGSHSSKENDDEVNLQLPRRHPFSAPASTFNSRLTRSAMLTKSESRDSIFSAKSDSAAYEQHLLRSHSSDSHRAKLPQTKLKNYNAQSVVYALKNDVESSDDVDVEQPINYSIKYNETANCKPASTSSKIEAIDTKDDGSPRVNIYGTYQETDLDQITDFSLRYAENQVELDADILTAAADTDIKRDEKTKLPVAVAQKNVTATVTNNEVLLILEDSVKCYHTEDTPYVISNAASITDLRQGSKFDASAKPTETEEESTSKARPERQQCVERKNMPPCQLVNQASNSNNVAASFTTGSYTPEKPINYCEEGTPGYFSRYDSLSSLDESPPNNHQGSGKKQQSKSGKCSISNKPLVNPTTTSTSNPIQRKVDETTGTKSGLQTTSNFNSAHETPLMFSRHSSMDSLIAEGDDDDDDDAAQCDDKSSVVSEFSRLASGVISPSEIPDSPTQSMPQSPRRNSENVTFPNPALDSVSSRSGHVRGTRNSNSNTEPRPLRSVFEDDLNTFHVENTPANFSSATSLSNLSFTDDAICALNDAAVSCSDQELKSEEQNLSNTDEALAAEVAKVSLNNANVASEGEEESNANNDDILLANCINMGMHRIEKGSSIQQQKLGAKASNNHQMNNFNEMTKQYCTEDTPALLSKVGSNSNLSAISICSSNANLHKDDFELGKSDAEIDDGKMQQQRHSFNFSDDVSSNASESGGAAVQSLDILEQCIRDGMKKKVANNNQTATKHPDFHDPIAMMRRGGNALPRYLPVSDEMNKYLVEDSPCNFSVVSGLSNLTVGSSLVGPAVQLEECEGNQLETPNDGGKATASDEVCRVGRAEQQWQDDSLSSLSIESEDDNNLLSQAIAQGFNRPKSNMGWNSSIGIGGSRRSNSLSASQPIPIKPTDHQLHRQTECGEKSRRSAHHHTAGNVNGNESFSSVDSSDSNDNQSKSLLELCILTGMHKTSEEHSQRSTHSRHTRRHHHQQHHSGAASNAAAASTQSNPNLKQFDSFSSSIRNARQSHTPNATPNRHQNRERARKDEKLLLECINTGISKKIKPSATTSAESYNLETRSLGIVGSECAMVNCMQPKNVPATSVAALDVAAVEVEVEVELSKANTTNTANTAASDVEKTQYASQRQQQQHFLRGTINNISSVNVRQERSHTQQNKMHNDFLDDITGERENPATMQSKDAAALDDEKAPNQLSACERTNDIGFNEENDDTELEHTNSDDSNQSFIIETTVSLLDQLAQPEATTSTSLLTEKHKDPDLMLKSVERLTMEFVSSAEYLLTQSSQNSQMDYAPKQGKKKLAQDCSSFGGGGSSNNTWNEDTHPNDVSFPSVSVTAPLVDSLTCDDANDDDDDDDDKEEEDELATRADHKEFHDFAEITPTNEAQLQPSLLGLIDDDEVDMYAASITPQLNSLDTETETLVNELETKSNVSQNSLSNGNNNNINFQLGGAVQTAALNAKERQFSQMIHGFNMTNSTLIANEARTIAENLLKLNNDYDNEDLTFSVNSLDLDNICPPSGMESLNVSGYYHESFQHSSSLPKYSPLSPQFCAKSPKFPRKTLPIGLMARRALGQFNGGSAESVNSSCNLLENIKPPSLMDELLDSMISVASIQTEMIDCCESMATTVSVSNYETATAEGVNGENDLDENTITLLHSCCDVLPCDDEDENTTTSDTAFITENENFSSAETTPQKQTLEIGEISDKQRPLTPKMRRKLSKDRFKTYTIASANNRNCDLPNALEEDEMLQIEIVETTPQPQPEISSPRSRRRASQDRYKTQTIIYSIAQQSTGNNAADRSLNSRVDCHAMAEQTMTHLTATATATPNSINTDGYNSTECDQNSETESCNNESIVMNGEKFNDAENASLEEGPQEKKPAVKTNETNNISKPDVKAVRGRKKAAYVSPYSMQYQRGSTTRLATNKATNVGNYLRKHSKASPTPPCIETKSPLKKKPIATEKGVETTPATTTVFERQGTFVKDEPTLTGSEMPVVVEAPPKSPASSNNSSPKRCASKLPTKRTSASTSTSPQTRSSNVSRVAMARKVPTIPTKPQRSNSNTNIRPTNARNAALSSRVSYTTPPSRSNSILNTTTTGENGGGGGGMNRINQTQSRIAGIWKRANNDAKSANGTATTPAGRNLRASNAKEPHTKSSTTLSTQKQPQKQLIRSSTFDNSPPPGSGKKKATAQQVPTAAKSIRPTHITSTKLAVHRNLNNNSTARTRNEHRFVRK